ncbi:MAG: glycosyl hydrolase family 2 [Candidatus Marinimicrobia bacterium]|nr:glycosyl hydrolase family 2 [Candidatus Neomarinimicrobiota bacterium]
MKRFYICCAIIYLVLTTLTFAKIKLPAVFGDKMVLQQKSKVVVWGWASPGETITVKGNWSRRSVTTETDENGKWMLWLKTPKAGGPYTLSILGQTQIELNDVMIGEVWICSGQSNMDMWMTKGAGKAGVLNYVEEIQNANYPDIRLFQVKKKVAETPQDDCAGTWKACNPDNVAKFSAVAYYFGQEIFEHLNVPVGLIQSSWGGTPAEAWTSREVLEENPHCRFYLDKLDSVVRSEKEIEKLIKAYRVDLNKWLMESYSLDKHVWRSWISPELDDSDWQTMNLPANLESAGLPDFDGVIWFRKHFDVPEEFLGKELIFDLGPVDDMDRTFINGKKVGEIQKRGKWRVVREYPVPADLLVPGENVVSIRVMDYKGSGGIYDVGDHLKIVSKDDLSMTISLVGEWRYKVAYDLKEHRPIPSVPGVLDKYTATSLYNAMIAPLIPFKMRGVIWYQGEGNRKQAYLYRELFPLMISDWRQQWKLGEFPFYYVQIAPFNYNSNAPIAAELRESQLLSLSVPNTGMVVTMDIGDVDDIHPRDKKEVGRRLSLWALAKTYNQKNITYSGSLYKSMVIKDDQIRIYFDYADKGLSVKDGELTHFSIAGSDSIFLPAKARIEDNTVIVWNETIQNPIAVRYGWSNTAELNLFNTAGLPASPFRTDNFRVSTQMTDGN